ncbi:MAG: M48 family metalloprotease [bacterium]|nr:MAG: M48 family metalloprotease [bacterium]
MNRVMNIIREFMPARAVIVIALVVFVAGCATTGINKGQVNIISSDEEVRMGQDFSKEVEKQFEIYDNVEVSTYVQGVGQSIVKVCDRQDIEYHFAVIKKDDLNAFALPGGYIYIYSGLMKELDDESQLAGVLAHEVGHVTARHSTERLTAMYGYQLLINLILGDDPNFYASLVSNIFATGGFLAYSRANEYEADRLGARYAHAVGYDPRGMTELLGKLKGTEEREPSKLEELLATHPPTSERINRVNGIVAGLPGSEGTRNKETYQKIKGKLP